MKFAVGYFLGTAEITGLPDSTYEHIALTADYKVAPGLGTYAEINLISDEIIGGSFQQGPSDARLSNDTTSVILGMKVSF